MTLKPLRGYILIELEEADLEVSEHGIVAPERTRETEMPAKGLVLAVGGEPKDEINQVKTGDKVIFKRWGGQDVNEEGRKLKLVKFEDLMGVYQ